MKRTVQAKCMFIYTVKNEVYAFVKSLTVMHFTYAPVNSVCFESVIIIPTAKPVCF